MKKLLCVVLVAVFSLGSSTNSVARNPDWFGAYKNLDGDTWLISSAKLIEQPGSSARVPKWAAMDQFGRVEFHIHTKDGEHLAISAIGESVDLRWTYTDRTGRVIEGD